MADRNLNPEEAAQGVKTDAVLHRGLRTQKLPVHSARAPSSASRCGRETGLAAAREALRVFVWYHEAEQEKEHSGNLMSVWEIMDEARAALRALEGER